MSRNKNTKTRETILRTACRLIHLRSYQGISMEDIASETGIKKANLFHYYPTKEELGLAVIDCAMKEVRQKIIDQFSEKHRDPVLVVGEIFSGHKAGMKKNGCCGGCIFGNLAQELSDHNEKARTKIAQHLEFWSSQLAVFLEHHRQRGYFRREMRTKASAESILALLEGTTLFCKAKKNEKPYDHARRMASTYLHSYQSR